MDFEDRDHSLQFYHYLCGIVGSEEVVKTRRKIFTAMDYISENRDRSFVNSGSRAEGLDIEGSDYDLMIVNKRVGVFESKHDISSSSHELILLMDTIDTKSGFTKLKVYETSERCLTNLKMCFETFQQAKYISSTLFREHYLPEGRPNMIIHGPCVSSKDDIYDVANSFRCVKWVKAAKQWIFRSRCTWPDFELTKSIVQYGILFVPIGCKGSYNEDLEWRISFSVAERLLIHSFSHTQLLCYALLKMLLKDIIKQKHEDLICSYFLKTIMFWLCEETTAHQWKPEMFVRSFMSCLTRLIYCVKYETCPHYFIPDNNLFEGRFSFQQQKTLLDTLSKIHNSPWNSFFHTAAFENLRRAQTDSSESYLKASSLSCLTFPSIVLPTLIPSTAFKQVLIRAVKQEDKHLFIHLLSISAMISMQDFLHLKERNKSFYRQYQILLRYFKTGVYSSSVHAWALLASLFYKFGRYRECIHILNYSLSKCTQYKILISLSNEIKEQSIFQKLKQTFGLSLTCKHFIIDDVIMIEPFHLLPTELAPLISERITIVKTFSPVVYLNVLNYFCLHHLGDNSGKIIALRDLELTIRKRYYIRKNKNLLKLAYKCLDIAKSVL